MASVMRGAVLFLSILFCSFAWAAPVWYADGAKLGRVDLASGRNSSEVPAANIKFVAATSDGGVWAVADQEVLYISSTGELISRTKLEGLTYTRSIKLQLAVDPYDGTAWILSDNGLVVHLDDQGQPLHTVSLPEQGSAIAVGLDQSVWISTPQHLLHLSRDGQSLPSIDVSARWPGPTLSLVVDSIDGNIWLIGADSVAKMNLATSTGSLQSVLLHEPIVSTALDPATSTIWVLTDKSLIPVYVDLRHGLSTPLAVLDASGSTQLAHDAASGVIVLGGALQIATVTITEGVPTPAKLAPIRNTTLSATPFIPTPLLVPRKPPGDRATTDLQPRIELELSATCPTAQCDVPSAYFSDFTLDAVLNGRSIGTAFHYDPVSRVLSYVPPAPLAPGLNRLSAQLTDRFGHQSLLVKSQFTTVTSSPAPGGQGGAPLATTANQVVASPQAGNQPPSVSLTAPANGASFTAGANITLTASASDSDGTVAKVDFYRGGTTLIGTATTAPYTITWNNVAAGTYSLTAKATDNKGAVTTSNAVSISVVANQPPSVTLTAPTNGTVVAAGSNVTVAASASDSDGSIAKVEFYSGSSLIGTATASPYTVAWNNVAPGNYSLTAKATDNLGATTTSSAIAVSAFSPPIVVLTSPANCAATPAPANISLKADAVSQQSTISKVDFYQGSTLLGTSTGSPYSYTWPSPAQGTYSLTARATDVNGLSTVSRAVSMTVTPPDAPPSVSITAPNNGSVYANGTSIQISATAADSDGSVSRVDFFVDGTLVGSATAPPYSVSWTPSSTVQYDLTAQATDNAGMTTTSATVSISVVRDTPPTVSISSPQAQSLFGVGAIVQVSASASSSSNSIARVDFYANGGLVGSTTALPYSVQWIGLSAPGTYTLTAIATDGLNVSTTSAPVQVSATSDNPPSVSITSPIAGAAFAAGAPVPIAATASDSDGSIARVDFYVNGAKVGSSTAAPYAFTWGGTANAGNYSLTAVATDNLGVATTSTAVQITVNPDQPPTVSISSPQDGSGVALGATIPVTATAADSDGSVSRVDFYANGVSIGGTTAAPYSVQWSPAAVGTYTLTAVATDNVGTTTTSPAVHVAVVQDIPPTVSLMEPIVNSTYSAGTSIALAAAASDPDGSVARVVFYANGTAIGSSTTTPYVAVWSNAPAGTYQVTAAATDNNGATTVSAAAVINVIGPQLVILSPQNAASLSGNTTLVTGHIVAPGNSGVVVNGQTAVIDESNNFYAVIPLAPGSNTITATLNTSDGYSVSQSVTLTSDGLNSFLEVDASNLEGVSSTTVSLTVTNHSQTSANVQINGGASVPLPPNAMATFSLSYMGAQASLLTVTAADGSGNSVALNYEVVVHDQAHLDQMLRALFNNMNNALLAGDKDTAMAQLSSSAQTKFGPAFDVLMPNYAAIYQSFSPLIQGAITPSVIEYTLSRTINGTGLIFFIYFVHDGDGIWRLDSM